MDDLKETLSIISENIEKIFSEAIDASDFSDLTHQQLHHLQMIVRMNNPTLSELAAGLGLTRPTVTVLVDKLVAKGYVRRVKCDTDKRCMHLHVDKKGEIINTIKKNINKRIEEKITTTLNETETAIMTELLRKIARNL